MIAITRQIVIKPTVYAEVVAESADDALAQVKSDPGAFFKNTDIKKSFLDEAAADLKNQDCEISELKFTSVGRANQYHSSSECEICKSLEDEEA
jgi:hypothetical protein